MVNSVNGLYWRFFTRFFSFTLVNLSRTFFCLDHATDTGSTLSVTPCFAGTPRRCHALRTSTLANLSLHQTAVGNRLHMKNRPLQDTVKTARWLWRSNLADIDRWVCSSIYWVKSFAKLIHIDCTSHQGFYRIFIL